MITNVLVKMLMLKLGLSIRRIFGSDEDSDSYKNPLKKRGFSTDFGFLKF